MIGGKTCSLYIELDPVSQPFYTAGDTVSGRVNLTVFANSVTVTDIQIKLRCDEYSAVAINNSSQDSVEKYEAKYEKYVAKRERQGKPVSGTYTAPTPRAYTQHHKHLEQISSVFVADGFPGGKQFFEKGTHKFDFKIVLPESVNVLPPHAPVPTRNGLKLGVKWSLKSIAHRPGHLTMSLRTVTEIRVHPTPKNVELGDLTRRSELSGQKVLKNSKETSYFDFFLGLVSGNKTSSETIQDQTVIVRLGYPELGIPQGPVKPNLSLAIEAPVMVTAVSVYLVQRCLASVNSIQAVSDMYKNMFSLGQVKRVRMVQEGQEDLSDLVSGFEVRDLLPAPFASKFLTISYALKIIVECASNDENKPHSISLEVPVNVLAPPMCWSAQRTGNYEARASTSPTVRNSFDSDFSRTSKYHNDSGLPTYGELIPNSNTTMIDEDTFTAIKRE